MKFLNDTLTVLDSGWQTPDRQHSKLSSRSKFHVTKAHHVSLEQTSVDTNLQQAQVTALST